MVDSLSGHRCQHCKSEIHRKMSEFRGFPQPHLNITPRLKIKADLEEARIEEEERLKVMDR